nr:pentatricopeptide repeat-containing protein [Quercus suber]
MLSEDALETFSKMEEAKVKPNHVTFVGVLPACAHEPLNLYASISQWEKMSHLRKKMKEIGIKAVPGCSSIDVDGLVHVFAMGDWSHPKTGIKRSFERDFRMDS